MSSMAESDEHDEIMIGALVSTVWLELRHRVNSALAAAGLAVRTANMRSMVRLSRLGGD